MIALCNAKKQRSNQMSINMGKKQNYKNRGIAWEKITLEKNLKIS